MKKLPTLFLVMAATATMAFALPRVQAVNSDANRLDNLFESNADAAVAGSPVQMLADDPFAGLSAPSWANIKTAKPLGEQTTRIAAAPALAEDEEDGLVLHAYSIFSDDIGMGEASYGLYRLPGKTGKGSIVFEGKRAPLGAVYLKGKMYTLIGTSLNPQFEYGGVDVYDVENQIYEGRFLVYDSKAYPIGAVEDPTDGSIYAVTYAYMDEDGNREQLSKLTIVGDSISAETIGEFQSDLGGTRQDYSSIVCDKNGQLYCIGVEFNQGPATKSNLYKIDKTTAELTLVGATGELPDYQGSACIDLVTGKMYWNVNPSDFTSWICEVDLNTGAATRLYKLTDALQCGGLYVASSINPATPSACTINSVVFNQSASLTGEVSVTAPSTINDGTEGTGTIKIVVLCNSEEVASVDDVAYGQSLTIEVTVPSAGSKNFSVYAVNEAGDGAKTLVKDVWCGPDYPEVPVPTLVYADGKMQLSWPAVTTSAHGGYLDPANVTYNVLKDGNIVAAGISETSYVEEVAEPTGLVMYSYSVEAMNGPELKSEAGVSNSVALGSIETPYTAVFTEEGMQYWTTIDANGDGRTWKPVVVGDENKMNCTYNPKLTMDDWLITPGLKLEAGKAYKVNVNVTCGQPAYPERIEVKFGMSNSVEAMTNTLFGPTTVDKKELILSDYLIPETDGTYYIGVHGISDPDTWSLGLNSFDIEAGIAVGVPVEPTNATVVADGEGQLKAIVSFKAPTKSFNGDDLTELTKVEVYRNESDLAWTFENPTPGAALSFVDEVPASGDYTYTIVGYNATGAGLPTTVSAYVGFAQPKAPASATIQRTDNLGEVIVTWDAVTQDIHGLTLPGVQYSVWTVNGNNFNLVAENITETTYTVDFVDIEGQKAVQLLVKAYNEVGESEYTATEGIPVGHPETGIAESFANAMTSQLWILGGNASWGLLEDASSRGQITASDGDNGFFGFSASSSNTVGELQSRLVSLTSEESAKVSFAVFNMQGFYVEGPDQNNIVVKVRAGNDTEWTVLSTQTVAYYCGENAGWADVIVDLSAYVGSVVQVSIGVEFVTTRMTLFDNIRIGNVEGESGVDSVVVEDGEDAPVVYYNLNGVRVDSDNLIPGIYVRVQGTKVTKVAIK